MLFLDEKETFPATGDELENKEGRGEFQLLPRILRHYRKLNDETLLSSTLTYIMLLVFILGNKSQFLYE